MNNPLHINDIFWTFQGESYHAGRRALFVRMPFCNLACSWCDTTFNTFEKVSESDLVKCATQEPGKFAVITGGEPSLNKHVPRVIAILKSLGFYIAMESNGTHQPPEGVDWLTVSPKRFTDEKGMEPFYIHPGAFLLANEFKYVVEEGFPFNILDRHGVIAKTNQRLYLSPEFNRMAASLVEIEKYIQANPHWRVSLQTHKWMGIK